jgi:putative DNA methylase
VNPESQDIIRQAKCVNGFRPSEVLASDFAYYGDWVGAELKRRVGEHYPAVHFNGNQLKVVAWIWCRTVANPNPAAGGTYVPLAKSFALTTKKGRST